MLYFKNGKKKKTRRNTPRHILIKLTKTKYKKKIKSSKGKATSNIQGNPICLTADLSAETLQARREWQDTFKKDLKETENKQTVTNNTITEFTNILE